MLTANYPKKIEKNRKKYYLLLFPIIRVKDCFLFVNTVEVNLYTAKPVSVARPSSVTDNLKGKRDIIR